MNPNRLKEKRKSLVSILKQYNGLIVAFSGGVDSTFLLAVACEVMKNLIAVTAESPLHPTQENKEAMALAQKLGVQHVVIHSREMNQIEFRANPRNRCYICKTLLFEDLLTIARKKGVEHVAHGATVDDLDDFRPGFIAANELGISAPLIDAGLTKDEIRFLSKEMNLKTWNKPSMACLATRIPYGKPITKKNLKMVARAEKIILNLGFTSCRVRLHDKIARIEINLEEMEKIRDSKNRLIIIKEFRKIGFLYVAVDLEGYTQGSMNK